MNEDLKEFIIAFILFLLILPLLVWSDRQDKKAITYCVNQGYSYDNCVSTLKGYN